MAFLAVGAFEANLGVLGDFGVVEAGAEIKGAGRWSIDDLGGDERRGGVTGIAPGGGGLVVGGSDRGRATRVNFDLLIGMTAGTDTAGVAPVFPGERFPLTVEGMAVHTSADLARSEVRLMVERIEVVRSFLDHDFVGNGGLSVFVLVALGAVPVLDVMGVIVNEAAGWNAGMAAIGAGFR